MLNDETARFSVKDIWIIVSLVALVASGYTVLEARIAKAEDRIDVIKSTGIPRRMDRLEYLICATEDKARATACQQMGVLK